MAKRSKSARKSERPAGDDARSSARGAADERLPLPPASPPRKNLPLLILAALLYAASLAFLVYMALS